MTQNVITEIEAIEIPVNPGGMEHQGCALTNFVAVCGAKLQGIDAGGKPGEPIECVVCDDLFENDGICSNCGRACWYDDEGTE